MAVGYHQSDQLGNGTETTYTPDGLPVVVEQRALTDTAPQRRTETAYDHGGNAVRTETMISPTRTDVSEMAWLADGSRHEETTTVTGHNATDVTWRWGYDPAGNPTHTWSPSAVAGAANNTAGEPTVMTYTADALVTEMVEPVAADGSQHRRTSYTHDPLGRVTLEEVELVGTGAASSPPKAYTWTTLGQPQTETGRLGAVTSFEYNADGQLTEAHEDRYAANLAVGYFLDGRPRLTTTTQPATVTRYQHFASWGDGLEGWRTFGTNPSGATPENIQLYQYNDARSLTETSAVGWGYGWDTWETRYDRAGQPITTTDPPNGAAPRRTAVVDRNPDGTVATRTLFSGLPGSSVIDAWSYDYDNTGRVSARARTGSAGTLSESYGYDEAGRLAVEDAQNISYDPNGNRLGGAGHDPQSFRADNSIAASQGPGGGQEAHLYTPWGGLTQDPCRSYSHDDFDRQHTATVRLDATEALARCEPLESLLDANSTVRFDALGRQNWIRQLQQLADAGYR